MTSKKSNSAFALLLTIATLAICVTTLGILTSRQLQQTLIINKQAFALQRYWAEKSFVETILPQSANWLKQINEQNPGQPSVTLELELNQLHLTARIDNEQAKINAPILATQVNAFDYQTALNEVLNPAPESLIIPIAIQTPSKNDEKFQTEQQDQTQRQPTWSTVFDPSELDSETLWSVAKHITIYGDGKIDFQQATDETIQAIAAQSLNASEIARLLDERNFRPDANSLSLIYAIVDNAEGHNTKQTQQLFTDESKVYSVWLTTRPISTAKYATTAWPPKRSYAIWIQATDQNSSQTTSNANFNRELPNTNSEQSTVIWQSFNTP